MSSACLTGDGSAGTRHDRNGAWAEVVARAAPCCPRLRERRLANAWLNRQERRIRRVPHHSRCQVLKERIELREYNRRHASLRESTKREPQLECSSPSDMNQREAAPLVFPYQPIPPCPQATIPTVCLFPEVMAVCATITSLLRAVRQPLGFPRAVSCHPMPGSIDSTVLPSICKTTQISLVLCVAPTRAHQDAD